MSDDDCVGVKIDGVWHWFDIDHLADAEQEINKLHMVHALWGPDD